MTFTLLCVKVDIAMSAAEALEASCINRPDVAVRAAASVIRGVRAALDEQEAAFRSIESRMCAIL